jgi:hypothetical protein
VEPSENTQKRLAKAYRVFAQLIATITFFWSTVKAIIADMVLPKELETVMLVLLIPTFYSEMTKKSWQY